MHNGPGLTDHAGGNAELAIPTLSNVAETSLSSPELYLNRELTWLSFNRRVLAEAEDERNPLLERLKFLAITASNLDEFFIKRIGGLKQQAASGVLALTLDGRTPQEQIAQCLEVIRQQEERQREVLASLLERLKTHGIAVLRYEQLSSSQQAALREHYITNIFPLITPRLIQPTRFLSYQACLSICWLRLVNRQMISPTNLLQKSRTQRSRELKCRSGAGCHGSYGSARATSSFCSKTSSRTTSTSCFQVSKFSNASGSAFRATRTPN